MKNLICSIGISALLFSNIISANENTVGQQIEIQACQKNATSEKAEFLTEYNKNVISVKPPVNKMEEVQTKITIGRAMVRIDNDYEECVVNAKNKFQDIEQYVML